jgi:hypothetical protein
MNRNFARTRDLLLSNPKGATNWEFLSISFDSDFDQPSTLTGYGGFYRHNNADRWLFAAAPPATLAQIAPPLGLVIMRQDSNISHNLRTVVVDSQGRLFRQFDDNLWTPQQLADAMQEAARFDRVSTSMLSDVAGWKTYPPSVKFVPSDKKPFMPVWLEFDSDGRLEYMSMPEC